MNTSQPKLQLDNLKGDQSIFYTAIIKHFIPIADGMNKDKKVIDEKFVDDIIKTLKENMAIDLEKAMKAAQLDLKATIEQDRKNKAPKHILT